MSGDIDVPKGGDVAGKRPAKSFCQSRRPVVSVEGGEDPADSEREEPAILDYRSGARPFAIRDRSRIDLIRRFVALTPPEPPGLKIEGVDDFHFSLPTEDEVRRFRQPPDSTVQSPIPSATGASDRPATDGRPGGPGRRDAGPRHWFHSAAFAGAPLSKMPIVTLTSMCHS